MDQIIYTIFIYFWVSKIIGFMFQHCIRWTVQLFWQTVWSVSTSECFTLPTTNILQIDVPNSVVDCVLSYNVCVDILVSVGWFKIIRGSTSRGKPSYTLRVSPLFHSIMSFAYLQCGEAVLMCRGRYLVIWTKLHL